jgi:phosphopantetheinyl transferase
MRRSLLRSRAPAAASADKIRNAMSATAVEIWFVDLDAAEAVLERAEIETPRLSREDLAEIARLVHPERRSERRLSRIALRLLITRAAGDGRYDGVALTRSASGRPSIAGAAFDFSVSHAAGYALLGLADGGNARIGVDLEGLRDLAMSDERRRRIVAAAEVPGGAPLSPSAPVDIADVLDAWVRLEALAKASGRGMARVLSEAGVIGGRNATRGGPGEHPLATFAVERIALEESGSRSLFAAVASWPASDNLPRQARRFPQTAEALRDWLQSGPPR